MNLQEIQKQENKKLEYKNISSQRQGSSRSQALAWERIYN